jgi:putative transcriptional regulator
VEKNMNEKVINKVHLFRSSKEITQQELADAVNVTRQTVIAIEKGNYTPSVLLALKIAHYFNKRIEEIFSYEK